MNKKDRHHFISSSLCDSHDVIIYNHFSFFFRFKIAESLMHHHVVVVVMKDIDPIRFFFTSFYDIRKYFININFYFLTFFFCRPSKNAIVNQKIVFEEVCFSFSKAKAISRSKKNDTEKYNVI